ncbi:MAG: hypothetical protein O3A13_05360 [Proteobacteria bacterium]|nr:hypothetical protein [Pseudomonadota bacterium]MDA0993042.1 hypothetical protein [Pseudomonadota bacterium]
MAIKRYCVISGTLFTAVALVHLLRILYSLSVQVDGTAIPMAASWIGAIVTGSLAAWAFRNAYVSGVA